MKCFFLYKRNYDEGIDCVCWEYSDYQLFLAELKARNPTRSPCFRPIPISCVRKIVGLEWTKKHWRVKWPLPWPVSHSDSEWCDRS
jgi:hypothetical protein